MGNIEKFDRMAGQYDTPEREAVAKAIAKAIRARISDGAGMAAMDYGCGTGLVGLELLDFFGSVLFVDASHNMVDVVREKLSCRRVQNADARCCDLVAERPVDLRADCVFLAQTLLHIQEVEPVLAALHAVLNPGGRLLIVDFDKNEAITSSEVHNGFEQTALLAAVKQAGFHAADSATFYHGKRMFMNQDASLFLLDAAK